MEYYAHSARILRAHSARRSMEAWWKPALQSSRIMRAFCDAHYAAHCALKSLRQAESEKKVTFRNVSERPERGPCRFRFRHAFRHAFRQRS